VAAVPEGFSVEAWPSEEPLEQKPLSLRCTADNYTYEQLRWYRLEPRLLQEQRGRPQELECRSVHLYAGKLEGQLSFRGAHNSWELEVHIPEVALADEGHYVCLAVNTFGSAEMTAMLWVKGKHGP